MFAILLANGASLRGVVVKEEERKELMEVERALQPASTQRNRSCRQGNGERWEEGERKERKEKRNEVETRVRERKYLRDEKKLPYGRILLFNLIFKGLQLSH